MSRSIIISSLLLLLAGEAWAQFTAPAYRVVARRRPAQPSEHRLTQEESRKVAGTSGDVLRAVAALPGASTPNDYLANLMVRGGGMEDNLYLFDGFPVAYPFHFGGVESVFHPALISAADFLPSGFDARFGDAQGGVLELRPRKPGPGLHGEASLSMILAGLQLGWGGDEEAGPAPAFSAAYRRGYFDLVLDQGSTLTGIPRYQDYAARAWLPAPGGEWGLSAFGSEDELKVYTDPSAVKNHQALGGEAGWRSSFHSAGLSYDSRNPGGWWLAGRAGASLARAAVAMGPDLFIDRRPYEWLLSLEAGAAPGAEHEANFGAQWRQTRTMLSGVFRRVPVELGSGFDFTSLPSVSVDALGSKGVLSAWAQDRWNPVPGIWATGGARFDRVDFSDEFHFSPRASLEWRPWERTAFKAAAGDYFQSPHGMETVPGWTSGLLKSSLTRLWSAGAEQGLGRGQELRVEAYRKDFERGLPPLTVSAAGAGSVVLNSASTGWAEGAELSWRFKPGPLFFGWLSYAWSNAYRSAGQGFYEADFSQPHVANAVGNFSLGERWELGARYRWATGIPYTPLAGRNPDGAGGWTPLFGAVNSRRLDPYQRLDLRAQYTWPFEAWQLRLYAEAVNALDWPNVTSVTYNDDYSGLRLIRQFPRLLFAGLEAEF